MNEHLWILFVCMFLFQGHTGGTWGVQSELQLQAYTTATALPDLSYICDLHHSSWQRQILNPLSKARDGTCILMVPSQTR